jgi:hypothetical protein
VRERESERERERDTEGRRGTEKGEKKVWQTKAQTNRESVRGKKERNFFF